MAAVHGALSQSPHVSWMERAAIWIHEHPTTVKTLEVGALAIGFGMLVSLPFAAPLLETGVAVSLGLTGTLLTLAGSTTYYALDIIIPPHHDMAYHAFTPGQCEGGRLYYEGDVPILSLDGQDPYKAGQAHGYLCGKEINLLSKRYDFVLHTLAWQPRANELQGTIAAIRQTIPPAYLREMEGLVEGYSRWADENRWQFPKRLTLEDAILFHLIPDSVHFTPGNHERFYPMPQQNVACTAVVDRADGQMTFVRNMDWPTFGCAGTYSLVIHRRNPGSAHSTVEVGVPGVVGTVTGMNDAGLCIAMNVCDGNGEDIRGMPAVIYNRACLEHCRSTRELEEIRDFRPLGPYHLTAADPENALSIHFYQSRERTDTIRRWEENNPLVTLNCRYSPTPNRPIHSTWERQAEINRFFQDREGQRPMEQIRGLPFVNNIITAHSVLMQPGRRTFKVAFDNAYAGDAPLLDIPVDRLFS